MRGFDGVHLGFIEKIYNVLCDEIEIECIDDNNHNDNNTISRKDLMKSLFKRLNSQKAFDSVCFIVLNVNKWRYFREKCKYFHNIG